MSQSISVETAPLVPEDVADSAGAARTPYMPDSEKGITVYRISGALFFGAVSAVAAVLERLDTDTRALILDFSAVPVIDSTAANMIGSLAKRARGRGIAIYIAGARRDIRGELERHGSKLR